MYQDILVPTDGTAGTETALDHALTMASIDGGRIHVLSVADKRVYLSASKDEQDEVLATLRQESEQAVDDASAYVTEQDAEVVSEVRVGIPYREILRYADEQDIDLVVIGTHGRHGRDKLVNLGSVTERVVSSTERPVFVVEIGEPEAEEGDEEESAETQSSADAESTDESAA